MKFMKLYNTLSRSVTDFKPLEAQQVRMYSCGPTVYDRIHIGNLSAFVAADTLRRVLTAQGFDVKHVMNFTDVDDKTIHRSTETYPELDRAEALSKLTRQYEDIFLSDMLAIGNDTTAIEFIRATDSIEAMRHLITRLYKAGFAYITDDGVYFSIEAYKKSGKTYGQLLELSTQNTSVARIDNDEYDKESVHDFALWKTRKDDEPAWEFELDGHNLLGRPGWHIECSVMSATSLGQPFDIHTGGIDLIFPHHENEIAQSTAGVDNPIYASYFVHNEHLLIDGKKMSKSLGNFFTLHDIQEKGFEPQAFRLMILQSHYRSQTNFTWQNLEAAQNRLKRWRALCDLVWQQDKSSGSFNSIHREALLTALADDLDTPAAMLVVEEAFTEAEQLHIDDAFKAFVELIEAVLGLRLMGDGISGNTRQTLKDRQTARDNKEWEKSDELRVQLSRQGIGVRDTPQGQIWYRI
jgi:cysteinyl-tRNA synthetase